MQERLTTVEAYIEDPGLLAVVEQIADQIEREDLPRHEVATVATPDAPLVTVGRQRDVDPIRLGANDLRHEQRR